MSEKLQVQHGDVLLFGAAKIPSSAKRQEPTNGRIVLAEGEATGHAHVICDLDSCDLYADENGTLYVEVKTPVALLHEEHATIIVQPGTYRVGRVREMDPFAEEIREVAD